MAPVDTRTEYLIRSSNLLRMTSPSTAAALSNETTSLKQRFKKGQQGPGHDGCTACGSINIKVRTMWPKQNRVPQNKRAVKPARAARPTTRLLVRSCLTCRRTIKHYLPGPAKEQGQTTATESSASKKEPMAIITHENTANTTGNASSISSKKRAKARKEGLQSLLDKSKQDSKPAATLSLMDFMRAA